MTTKAEAEQWRKGKDARAPVCCWTCDNREKAYCNFWFDIIPEEFYGIGCGEWVPEIPF